MLASKCAKCGKNFVGWSLAIPENQKCPYCGSKLAIHDEAIELDLDYMSLRQSMDSNIEEWQVALEKTLAIYFREGVPNVTSTN